MDLVEIKKKIKFKNFIDLNKKDSLQILEYRNLPDIRKNMLTQDIISNDTHFKFIKHLKNNEMKKYFAVIFNNQLIGAVYLVDINLKDKHAKWGIYIGKHKFVGIGAVVTYVFFEFVFNELMFECLQSEVFHYNKSAIQLNKTFGFVKNNKNDDLLFMSIDKSKWIQQDRIKILKLIERLG